MAPKLIYFPIRGRGEPIRLALAAAGVSYEEKVVNREAMKEASGTAAFPFGQCPIYEDGNLRLCQMDAIVRHIAREHNLYGGSIAEAAHIDEVLGGVESLRTKYLDLIYGAQLAADAKEKYCDLHIKKGGLKVRNGGAHFGYLSGYLERNTGGNGFIVGNKLSIGDIQLFDIVDIHMRDALFPGVIQSTWPVLAAHHKKISEIPEIAAYLASDRRMAAVNGNSLG